MGVLLSAGHRLPDILDLTFPQIQEVGASILMARAKFLEELISPIAGAFDPEAKYKPARVSTGRSRERRMTPKQKAQQEVGLRFFLASNNIPVTVSGPPPATPGEGEGDAG